MCLVSPVFIIFVDEMNLDLGVTGKNASACGRGEIIEGVKFIDLIRFEEENRLPEH